MNTLLETLAFISIVETLFLLASFIYAFYLWSTGALPVLIRIGNGLAKRKIALFASSDNVNSLKTLLTDSGLFRDKNILVISRKEDIGRAEDASVYLVHWQDSANYIDEILRMKKSECPMIVYSPYNLPRIPDEQMVNLDGKRHTAVTQFRGRLLNDIVTSMITTNL